MVRSSTHYTTINKLPVSAVFDGQYRLKLLTMPDGMENVKFCLSRSCYFSGAWIDRNCLQLFIIRRRKGL